MLKQEEKGERERLVKKDTEGNVKKFPMYKTGTIGWKKTNNIVLDYNSKYQITISKSILIYINYSVNK